MIRYFLFSLLILKCISGHGHDGHDHHGHAHDANPAFKYSRAANEDPIYAEDEILDEDIVDVPTAHGHSHDHHGHSHGGHGHSHGGHGHSHGGHGHSHGGGQPQRKLTPEEHRRYRDNLHKIWDEDEDEVSSGWEVWSRALGATLLISAAPFFILFLIPLDNSPEKQGILKVLLSFASGGLLGDAFLHLIPHAIMAVEGGQGHGHSHNHGHSHGGNEGEEGHVHDMTVGLGVLSGIFAFLCVEKFVILMKGERSHSHSHAPPPSPPKEDDDKKKKEKSSNDEDKKSDKESKKEDKSDKESKKEDKSDKESKKEEKNEVSTKTEEGQSEIKVAGFLNLAADCFHNFTDGLAIGASFLAGESVGVVTTLTILLHEVPHEIGDFAILIQSGVPRTKAIFLQLLTAVGAISGCLVSLFAGGTGGGEDTASGYILPFTAGGFIYIATVSVIPGLLEGKSSLKQSLAEMGALLVGVAMMVVIAQYE